MITSYPEPSSRLFSTTIFETPWHTCARAPTFFVSVMPLSCRNEMSVCMVVANYIHHSSYDAKELFFSRGAFQRLQQ